MDNTYWIIPKTTRPSLDLRSPSAAINMSQPLIYGNDENGYVSGRTWQNSLCDVCALPLLCINVMFCNACVVAQIAGRAKEYVFVKDFNAFLKLVIGLFVITYACNALNVANTVTLFTDGHGDIPSQSTSTTSFWVDAITRSIMYLCGFASLVIMVKLRIRVRAQKNIQPNLIEDVLCTIFCCCCVTIQTAREVGVGEECMNMTDPNIVQQQQMSRSDDSSATGFDKV